MLQRLSKLSKSQRQDYLDTLPDEMLEEYITAQTGIPRGRLTNGMLEAIAKGEELADDKLLSADEREALPGDAFKPVAYVPD